VAATKLWDKFLVYFGSLRDCFNTYGGVWVASVDEVVEDGVVSAGCAVRRRWTRTVAAAGVTFQTLTVVRGVVRRRTHVDTAAVFDVVDAVSVALVRTVLATGATGWVARGARLAQQVTSTYANVVTPTKEGWTVADGWDSSQQKSQHTLNSLLAACLRA